MHQSLVFRASNRCSHRSNSQIPQSCIRSLWSSLPIITRAERQTNTCPASRSTSTINRSISQSFSTDLQHRTFSTDALSEKQERYEKHVGLTRVRLSLKAGKGGAGCSAFHRDLSGRGTVHGSPSGGNGGPGGSVYITCSSELAINQFDFGVHHYNAGAGERGSGKARVGARGQDIHIKVPPNTRVYMIRGHIEEDDEPADTQHSKILRAFNGRRVEFMTDLTKDGTSLLMCKGGAGGYGNRSLMSDSSTFNKFSSTGELGEACEVLLEMTVMADVGCVGFPNAGKSSLLNALTRAQPKIASYPFTTIRPEIGVVEADQATNQSSDNPFLDSPAPSSSMGRLTLADLPGLVEHAHRNVGLGHSFLAHLQRCSVLVYVIDCSGAVIDETKSATSVSTNKKSKKSRDPSEDFLALRRELRLYDRALIEKPWLVLANQMDRKPATANKNLQRLKQVIESELAIERMSVADQSIRARVMADWMVDDVCVPGSCMDRSGLDRCVEQMKRLVEGVNIEKAKDDAILREQEQERERKEKEEMQQRQRRPRRSHRPS